MTVLPISAPRVCIVHKNSNCQPACQSTRCKMKMTVVPIPSNGVFKSIYIDISSDIIVTNCSVTLAFRC